MPIPADCIKLRWTFDLDSTDIAVFGVNGQLGHTTGNIIDWQAYMNMAAEKGRDKLIEHLDKALFCAGVRLLGCDAYHLSTAGKTLHRGSAPVVGVNDWVGQASLPSQPWESSLCISVYGYTPGTFDPQARSKRGRFYLPPMAASTLDGKRGHLGGNAVNVLQTSVNGLLQDLEGMVLGPSGQGADFFKLGIISSATNDGATPNGQFTRAKQWGYDVRFDSQRRRENKDRPAKTWTPINQEP